MPMRCAVKAAAATGLAAPTRDRLEAWAACAPVGVLAWAGLPAGSVRSTATRKQTTIRAEARLGSPRPRPSPGTSGKAGKGARRRWLQLEVEAASTMGGK